MSSSDDDDQPGGKRKWPVAGGADFGGYRNQPKRQISRTRRSSSSSSSGGLNSQSQDETGFFDATGTSEIDPDQVPPGPVVHYLVSQLAAFGVHCPLLVIPRPPSGEPGSSLGVGRYGETFLGHRIPGYELTLPQAHVAVKIAPTIRETIDKATPNNARSELTILGLVTGHPHVVSIYCVVEKPFGGLFDNDYLAIAVVQEFISGGTLKDFLEEVMVRIQKVEGIQAQTDVAKVKTNSEVKTKEATEPIPTAAADKSEEFTSENLPIPASLSRGWIVDIIQTLAWLRSPAVNVSHNDLHQGNILLDGNGEVVLIDWGLADREPALWELTGATDLSQLTGTIRTLVIDRRGPDMETGPEGGEAFVTQCQQVTSPIPEPNRPKSDLLCHQWLAGDSVIRYRSLKKV